jgi:PhoPQ-activated pathogenicity-related protein
MRVVAFGCDEVCLWQATDSTARDFRNETMGATYTSSVLTVQPGGVSVASVSVPPQGWTCFMVAMNCGNGEIYTTGCCVLPDVEPYDGTPCL